MAIDNEPVLTDEAVRQYLLDIIERNVRIQGEDLERLKDEGKTVVMRVGSHVGIDVPYDTYQHFKALAPNMVNVGGIELTYFPDPSLNRQNGRLHLGYRTALVAALQLPDSNHTQQYVADVETGRYGFREVKEHEYAKVHINPLATPMSNGLVKPGSFSLNGLGMPGFKLQQEAPIETRHVDVLARRMDSFRPSGWTKTKVVNIF